MSKLSYVNVFARNIEALSGFYQRVFDFPEVEAIRSPIFRGLDAGSCCIGFNAPDAYDLLHPILLRNWLRSILKWPS